MAAAQLEREGDSARKGGRLIEKTLGSPRDKKAPEVASVSP